MSKAVGARQVGSRRLCRQAGSHAGRRAAMQAGGQPCRQAGCNVCNSWPGCRCAGGAGSGEQALQLLAAMLSGWQQFPVARSGWA